MHFPSAEPAATSYGRGRGSSVMTDDKVVVLRVLATRAAPQRSVVDLVSLQMHEWAAELEFMARGSSIILITARLR